MPEKLMVDLKRWWRLIAISEAVHARANTGDFNAQFLLLEARCDCERCPKRVPEGGTK